MSAEVLASILAIVMALAFAYIPGLGKWFTGKPGEFKAMFQGIGLVLIAVVVFSLACAGLGADLGLAVTCDKAGAIGVIRVLIAALIANQATFTLAVRPFVK